MKRVVFLSIFLALTLFLYPKSVEAVDCNAKPFDTTPQGKRDLTVCIGGFSSEADLKSNTATFKCTGNSNIPFGSNCSGTGLGTYNLVNAQIAHDANGYFTCLTQNGLPRAVGSVNVSFTNTNTGASVCNVNVLTKPDDWKPVSEGMPWSQDKVKKICEFAGSKQGDCESCMGSGTSAWTAIGCIPTDPSAFIKKFVTFGAGLAGGIAFLLILFGGFQVMTSTGNPEKLNAGKELVVSAIAGLLLVIFSIFLLKIIGYNILGIPGFG